MPSKKSSIRLKAILIPMVVVSLTNWTAGGDRVLYTFAYTGGSDPQAGMTLAASSNLYGTTVTGGAYDGGTVFELTPKTGGKWTETVVHSFGYATDDGCNPYAPVVFDSAGNLYGTTGSCGAYGRGIAFELIRTAEGAWTEKVLHNFASYPEDGKDPFGGLVIDTAGNLYGTTVSGGANAVGEDYSGGTVFELMPTNGGNWTETVLYSFCGHPSCADGDRPMPLLLLIPAAICMARPLLAANTTVTSKVAVRCSN